MQGSIKLPLAPLGIPIIQSTWAVRKEYASHGRPGLLCRTGSHSRWQLERRRRLGYPITRRKKKFVIGRTQCRGQQQNKSGPNETLVNCKPKKNHRRPSLAAVPVPHNRKYRTHGIGKHGERKRVRSKELKKRGGRMI
ncbi:hypothetical protein LZ32DRAFT_172056 [Colletotrichum eremochloae]|nr:hypothetical protein LZ32DRAFT_172056 [Colletotrichum eremochloae]